MLYEGTTRIDLQRIPSGETCEVRTSNVFEKRDGKWWHYDRITVISHATDAATALETFPVLTEEDADANLARVLSRLFHSLRIHSSDPRSEPSLS